MKITSPLVRQSDWVDSKPCVTEKYEENMGSSLDDISREVSDHVLIPSKACENFLHNGQMCE